MDKYWQDQWLISELEDERQDREKFAKEVAWEVLSMPYCLEMTSL